MALPHRDAPCWQRLAGGGLARLRSDNVAVQMMTKRLERSADPLQQKAYEIHEFFQKWERGLGNEIAQFA